MKNRLIVALDFNNLENAIAIVDQLDQIVEWFKVGKELFTKVGPKAIEVLKDRDKKIFLDLKFHDIPNTVAGAVASATEIGATMINVHASGGSAMMSSAIESAEKRSSQLGIPRPIVLGVTVLTSIDDATFQNDFASSRRVADQVVYLAQLAEKSGLDGVVASPLEIDLIRQVCKKSFRIVTPGVRPIGSQIGDQRRVTTPKEAISKGATQIVVGRPITQSEDPHDSAKAIIEEIT